LIVQWVRRVGTTTGASVGALMGALFGLYLGSWGFLIAWAAGGDVGFAIGLFVVLPVAVLGGAFLGARLFLRLQAFANRLRLRHPRWGALAWVFVWAVLAVVAAFAAVFVYVLVHLVSD
jgi:hypothetical protein